MITLLKAIYPSHYCRRERRLVEKRRKGTLKSSCACSSFCLRNRIFSMKSMCHWYPVSIHYYHIILVPRTYSSRRSYDRARSSRRLSRCFMQNNSLSGSEIQYGSILAKYCKMAKLLCSFGCHACLLRFFCSFFLFSRLYAQQFNY